MASPVSWFDWSDFRADVGFRIWLTRLGSVTLNGVDLENLFQSDQYGITHDPEAFKEFWAILYIDRVGLRYHQEDPWCFGGRAGPQSGTRLTGPLYATLEVSGQRLGIDVDLIRYPTVKAGINFDYHNQPMRFTARYYGTFVQNQGWQFTAGEYFDGDEPLTIGVHGRVIPFRVREIPFTIQARFRLPLTVIPYLKRDKDAQITEFEVSAGLRPNIWDASLFGHTTFSVAVNAGFRWDRLVLKGDKRVAVPQGDRLFAPPEGTYFLHPTEATLNATWQGGFIEAVLTF